MILNSLWVSMALKLTNQSSPWLHPVMKYQFRVIGDLCGTSGGFDRQFAALYHRQRSSGLKDRGFGADMNECSVVSLSATTLASGAPSQRMVPLHIASLGMAHINKTVGAETQIRFLETQTGRRNRLAPGTGIPASPRMTPSYALTTDLRKENEEEWPLE